MEYGARTSGLPDLEEGAQGGFCFSGGEAVQVERPGDRGVEEGIPRVEVRGAAQGGERGQGSGVRGQGSALQQDHQRGREKRRDGAVDIHSPRLAAHLGQFTRVGDGSGAGIQIAQTARREADSGLFGGLEDPHRRQPERQEEC